MNDDIRRALDELASDVPVPISRRGAVMARIATVQRRKLAAQAALGGVLLVTGSFGAARLIQPAPVSRDSLVTQDESPTSEPKPTPTKEKPKPKPTEPAAKPTPAPAPTKTYVKPDPVKTTTKPVEKPAADGLAVELYNATDAPRAGSQTDLKVKAYDGAGRLLRVEVLFGDGTSKVVEPATSCTGEPLAWREYFGHVYANPGTYEPRVTVTTGGCGAATETRSKASVLTVKPKEQAGNGPAQPTVSADPSTDARKVVLALAGADADGYVKKFYVDWGDGTTGYVGPRSLDGCQPGKPSQWQPSTDHTYAEPGSYTVKVTVMSVACDGSQGQTATTTLTVTV